MSRRLIILRHAKSAWDTDASTDFDRPLAKRGKKDAPRMGSWLLAHELVPDYVVSSPALRAKETVTKACEEIGTDVGSIHWDQRVYMGDADSLLRVLADCPDAAATAMIVGHNPGLEDLVEFLVGEVDVPEDGKLLPTAAVACLEIPGRWDELEEGEARLISITRPRSLES